MSFDDFCEYFTTINVCHVPNTKTLSIRKTWCAASYKGFWKLGSSAGGCVNNKESFFTNPQVAIFFLTSIRRLQKTLINYF
jgi:hypothetical protein